VHEPSKEKSHVSMDRFYEELEQIFNHFLNHMSNLIADFNTKLAREDVFKPITGNKGLPQDSNGNCFRIVNCRIKNLVVNSTMFLHQNINKYSWIPPDGNAHNQMDNIFIDRR